MPQLVQLPYKISWYDVEVRGDLLPVKCCDFLIPIVYARNGNPAAALSKPDLYFPFDQGYTVP